jgi:hypothetical protein
VHGLNSVQSEVADLIAFDLLRRAYLQLSQILIETNAPATIAALSVVESEISMLVDDTTTETATASVGHGILAAANRKVQAILRERPAGWIECHPPNPLRLAD